jgi:hypothetical protein
MKEKFPKTTETRSLQKKEEEEENMKRYRR